MVAEVPHGCGAPQSTAPAGRASFFLSPRFRKVDVKDRQYLGLLSLYEDASATFARCFREMQRVIRIARPSIKVDHLYDSLM